MDYETPEVKDLGTLAELTQGAGSLGFEDGSGKTITAVVDELIGISIGILP
ncbi:lasso RiPP family leader peptide-containing protein [Conexibacter sp. SYSU D00693]|uniref:lasso RiPP family leader peptide-containing protein n=1 Tax=Conexibacter sp. SYSU D00693 TaxID=2812560 RepID=UPI00196B528B|nr:lasso RiPP family leader peptide-containing protein [Conexibacter sp. SYSU D00693]